MKFQDPGNMKQPGFFHGSCHLWVMLPLLKCCQEDERCHRNHVESDLLEQCNDR